MCLQYQFILVYIGISIAILDCASVDSRLVAQLWSGQHINDILPQTVHMPMKERESLSVTHIEPRG